MSLQHTVRRLGGRGRQLLQRALSTAGVTQSERQLAADAQEYWGDDSAGNWKGNSHWRDAPEFADGQLWSELGRRHLTLFEHYTALLDQPPHWGRVVEWGSGGGLNAVHFAPRAEQFVGVDVSAASLDECGKQVAAVCRTPFQPILIDVDSPETALDAVDGPCDIFFSFYVFELIPSPEYGERLLRIAFDLLAPGGVAMIQTKYDEGRFGTRPLRRAYRSNVAQMTTYRVSAFWELAEGAGFHPEAIHLVPQDEVDHRYAYYLLTKPA